MRGRRLHPGLALAPAALCAWILAAHAAGTPPQILVSAAPELAGLQMQLPVWAPGDAPRLVHEATDRSRRSILRIVDAGGRGATIPASQSTRLSALGVGHERSDRGASWWSPEGLFFVRSARDVNSLQFWDGTLRDVEAGTQRVAAVVREGAGVLVTRDDGRGLDLFRYARTDLSGPGERLTSTPDEVEHSVTPLPDGRVAVIGTGREGTRLLIVERAVRVVALPVAVELLSLAALADGRLAVWARAPDRDTYSLLVVDPQTGATSSLVGDAYLPPGIAPRPAVSLRSGWIYFVRSEPGRGNPIVRIKPDGRSETLTLGTRGHQEVAASAYPGTDGQWVDWLAVVAVGDRSGDDVTNHLYVGPAPDAP